MALIAKPKQSAETLLKNIKVAMDAGKIDTWTLDSAGDFTHSPTQWKNLAWFRPKIRGEDLVFIFLGNKNVVTTKVIYGVYHGRSIEMLLTHFDLELSQITATSLPREGDVITTSKP
jgi:hypothetical protein